MVRLRVSDLDAWVRFLEPEIPEFEITIEEFLAQMRREMPPTPQMSAGQAFHKIPELAQPGDAITTILVDDFEFYFAGDMELALPSVRELSIEKMYDTPSGPVLLRGRVDAEERNSVTDYKLTFSTLDVERYADSLQWKAYLDMMPGKSRFWYHVFTAKMDKPNKAGITPIEVREMHSFDFWAYPQMGDEVQRRVNELAEFVVRHVPSLIVPDAVAA